MLAFETNNASCKSLSGETFWTTAFSWKDQWHIMRYRNEGSEYILVFNKQQENCKLNQYVQQNVCSFATDSGYSWDSRCSCRFYLHFSFRTDMETSGLKSYDFKSSHSMWETSFPSIKDDTITFITGLNNQTSSRGCSARKLLAPVMSDDSWAMWEIMAHLHIRHSCFSQAFIQMIKLEYISSFF